MNGNCTLTINASDFSKKLAKAVNNNKDEYGTILSAVWKNDTFTSEFLDWCIKKYGNDAFNIKANKVSDTFVKYAKEYTANVRASVYTGTENRNVQSAYEKYDYDGIEDREEGKVHSAKMALLYWNRINNTNSVPKENLKIFLGNELRNNYRKALEDVILLRGNVTYDKLVKDREQALQDTTGLERIARESAFYELTLEGEKTDRERSLLAVFKELSTKQTTYEYIDGLLNKKELQDIKKQIDIQEGKDVETQDEETQRKDEDALSNVNNNNNEGGEYVTTNDDFDTAITAYNSHMGQYTTYMTHIGARLRNYFNTLPVLRSAIVDTAKDAKGNQVKVYDIDTNNRYGFNNYMDADQCASMLYSESWQFTDVPTMISVIRKLGRDVPAFRSFVKMANDLDADYDFAYEMFTVFSKTIVSKLQVISTKENNTTLRIANQRANRRESFRQSISNALRSACTTIDSSVYSTRLKEHEKAIAEIKSEIKNKLTEYLDEDVRELTPKLIKLVRQYFNNVEPEAIATYINAGNNANGNVVTQAKNAIEIFNLLKETNEYSQIARNNLLLNQNEREKANKERTKQIQAINSGKYVSQQELIKDLSTYSSEIITGNLSLCLNRAITLFEPYSAPNIQLNHPNVKGNNSSDVINNSYVTNLIKMINLASTNQEEYVKKLIDWGQRRLDNQRSVMYNAILFDQYSDNVKISDGIFSFIDEDNRTQIKLNDHTLLDAYGHKKIDIVLFDGANDVTNGNAMTYNEMVEGDYFPTVYNSFISKTSGQSDDRAYYFPRTPSDAPTIFALLAQKYGTSVFGNNQEERERIAESVRNDFLQQAKDISYKKPTPGQIYTPDQFINLDDNDNYNEYRFLDNLLGEDIFLSKRYKEFYEEKEGIIIDQHKENGKVVTEYLNEQDKIPLVRYLFKHNDDRIAIFVTGDIKEKNGTQYLSNPRIYSIFNTDLAKRLNAERKLRTPEGEEQLAASTAQIIDVIADKVGNRAANWTLQRQHTATIFGKEYTEPKKVVDTSSKEFQLVKNQFKQELLDMAIALDHYFVMDNDGLIDVDYTKGKVPKPKLKNKDKKFNETGYIKYHLSDNGKVLESKGGKYVLDGRVFHSEKFTLSIQKVDKKGNVTEDKENYLDKIITTTFPKRGDEEKNRGTINLFYGATSGNYLHVVRDASGKIVDVSLTNDQNQRVDEELSKFLIAYQEQINAKVRQYSDFIKAPTSKKLDERNSFGFNYFMTMCAYDDLFEGNTKFYKDSQDVLKRAKEKQGSGVPYANVNYLTNDDYDLSEIEDCQLNKGTYGGELIKDIISRYLGHRVAQRWAFTGVTIRNTKMTNDAALKRLTKQLSKILKSQGFSPDMAEYHAKNILYGPEEYDEKTGEVIRRGGFQEQKVNDAQSYITVDEWIRRIAARGQLMRYMPLIKKLLDPNVQLSTEDIEEFVQVQKNFYYDQIYDERYGIFVPRQIKNAEFVLVPKLIKGTELEHVYNMMVEAGIDQLNTLETSKAANEEVITLWDNNGKFTGADTFVADAQRLRQVYSYKYLYTQQETPQHMNSHNKAGLQIVKKILDNIGEDSDVYDEKLAFFDNMIQNIRESFQDLMLKFDIPIDANGNIVTDENGQIKNLNKKEFYARLKEELLRLGVDNNMIDYVTLDEYGEPLMPPLFNMVLSRFEQVVQSMFNQAITRQKLPGFHAAQVTNIGWNEFTLSKEVQNTASYAKELEYHPMTWKKGDKVISNREYNALEDKTGWEENGPAKYIEVMISAEALGVDRNSAAYRGKSDAEILQMLKDEGLDEVIGYRIPTEGKQSMALMKIVGFLPKSYGSTIIVPNDWVSQTGSDFDIDSVYGIQFNVRKSKNGYISKVNYLKSDNYGEGVTIKDWYRYIKQFRKRVEINSNTSDETKAAINALDDAINSCYEVLEEEKSIFNSLSEVDKAYFREGDDLTKQTAEYNDAQTKADKYMLMLEYRISDGRTYLQNNAEEFEEDPEGKAKIEAFIQANEEILEMYRAGEDEDETLSEKIIRLNQDKIEKAIEGTQLLSYDDFVYAAYHHPEQINTKRARDNRILDAFMNILRSDDALEENLSRSNFDDITYWKNRLMNPNLKAARKNRSAYNILDQIAYQEDAMVGYKLKGASVQLDSVCSICNMGKPKLDNPITIVYDDTDYDFNIVKRAFGQTYDNIKRNDGSIATEFTDVDNAKYDKKKHTITVRHDTYGHSQNNRNVVGKLITAYSSQTTAHILDAIKEGAVPGVNTYTFSVYKTLLNIGSDFKCAIGYIMQPGIERIVKNYNANHSVYSNRYSNPIKQSIRDIAEELTGEKFDRSTTLDDVFEKLQPFEKEFNEILGNTDKKNSYKISFNLGACGRLPIIVSKLVDRLQDTGEFSTSSPVGNDAEALNRRKLLFDLAVVLSFNHLSYVANDINAQSRVLNPDKFGAKKSIFETAKVFDDIAQQIFNFENIKDPDAARIEDRYGRKQTILSLNGKHFLQAVYPGIENSMHNDLSSGIIGSNNIHKSVYPTLYAYLKYSSGTSIVIARRLFDTQRPQFVNAIMGFRRAMSGVNPRMTDTLYSDLEKYTLTYLYNEIPQISHPVVWDFTKNEIVGYDNSVSELDEQRRVLGLGYPSGVLAGQYVTNTLEDGSVIEAVESKPFSVVDLNNPTESEVKDYMKLTPAQKVEFIKTNFAVKGLFGKLDVSLYNIGSRGARYQDVQTIEFAENTIDKDVLLDDFDRIFNSRNPLVKLAAIDLIKYAVMFEGFRMRSRGITKLISNKPLMNTFGHNGIGFIDVLKDKLQYLDKNGSIADRDVQDEIYERYLRSHDVKEVRTLYWNPRRADDYGLVKGPAGTFIGRAEPVVRSEETEEEYLNNVDKEFKSWKSKLVYAGVLAENEFTEEKFYNKYLYVSESSVKHLYRIKPMSDGSVVLYPLNRLDENEVSALSARSANRKEFPYKDYYETLLNELNRVNIEANAGFEFDDDYIEKFEKRIAETKTETLYRDITTKLDANDMPAAQFDINTIANDPNHPFSGGMSQAIDEIVAEFAPNGFWNSSPKHIYIQNKALTNYIYSNQEALGSKQKIYFNQERNKQVVNIYRTRLPKRAKALLAKENYKYVIPNEEFEKELSKVLNLSNPIEQANNKHLAQLIRNARSYNGTDIDYLLIVKPVENSATFAAGMEEANADLYDYMDVDKSKGNEKAIREVSAIRKKGIENHNIGLVENSSKVIGHLAAYVNSKVDELINHTVNEFVKDPELDGVYIKMKDPRIQDMMVGNPKLVNKYAKTINEIQALVDRTAPYYRLNVKSNDLEMNFFLNDIKKAHEKLLEIPLEQLRLNLAEGYVAKLSKDPLIKDGIIKVFDGFFKTTGWAWAFNDIMENGNPLLQTILTDVMGNLDAMRIAGDRLLRNHHAKIEEIRRWANERGIRFDPSRVFTHNGRLVLPFSDEFITDLDNLYKTMTDAAKEHGYGSYEHLKAKLEYDEFVNTYTNQEATPKYYKRRLKLERKMLTDHKDIYVEYMKLWYKTLEIRNYSGESGLNDDMKRELREYEFKIRGLSDESYYYDDDGTAHSKKQYDDLSKLTPKERIYSQNEAQALHRFLELRRKDDAKTFTYDSIYGFHEQLKTYLNIVATYEQVDPQTGIQRIPQERLEEIEEYRVAKDWIRENAHFDIHQTENAENNPNSLSNKLKKALSKLALASNGRRLKLKKFLSQNAVYDAFGIPDPNKLTSEQLKELRQKQEEYYYGNNSAIPRGSDMLLINSKNKSDVVYSQYFWQSLHYNFNEANADYVRIVTELNKELSPLYDEEYGGIHFEWIPDTAKGIEKLRRIARLYKELNTTTTSNRDDEELDETELENIKKFKEENTEDDTNWTIYNQQLALAQQKSREYFIAWRLANCAIDRNGVIKLDSNNNLIPKRAIYTRLKAKNEEQFIDKERTENLALINKYYRRTPTKYYYQALRKAQNQFRDNPDGYAQWFADNHVYNPYNRKYEPLEIYMKQELRYELFDENEYEGKWEPRNKQRTRKVQDGYTEYIDNLGNVETFNDPDKDMTNHKYNERVGIEGNYKKGANGGKYDSKVELSEAEVMFRDYIKQMLIDSTEDERAKRFFERGYIPKKAINQKSKKEIATNAIAQQFGISLNLNKNQQYWTSDISYAAARQQSVPMTEMLKSKELGSVEFREEMPKAENYETPEEYRDAYDDWKKRRQQAIDKNKEVEQAIMDRDWMKVLDEYIVRNNRHNAIQQNIEKLYYLHNMIRDQKVYDINYSLTGTPELNVDKKRSNDKQTVYTTERDENLLKQLDTLIHRIVFDEWKEKNSAKTRAMNHLQNFTSANYMMLNFRGGIANVTLGESSIIAEAAAGEQIGYGDWLFGHVEWNKGIMGFCRGMYSDEAFGLQDAIAKYFNVVDYDEQRGTPDDSLEKYTRRVRNAMFSPQTIGEHYMQNSMLFAMLRSHKLISIPDDARGIGVTFMNKAEFIRYRQTDLLLNILNDEEKKKFNAFKSKIKDNASERAQYAWRRRDVATEFAYLYLDKGTAEKYLKAKKDSTEALKREFDQKDNLYNQLDFADGRMIFKAGSQLDKLNRWLVNKDNLSDEEKKELEWQSNNFNLTKADVLCGLFAERVRKVNNKIHGVYNRVGRAYIENKWWGSVVMQYHKHLPIGLLKRYRTRGFYSESRGTTEKGIFATIEDILSLNARKVKSNYLKQLKTDAGLQDAEIEALEGVSNILKYTIDQAMQLAETMKYIPDYDKANIRRQLGDLLGVVAGLLVVVGCLAGGDDDDKDSILWNLALYEGDRLASEAFLYNPIGMWTETKTLMSTPIAGMSVINDLFSAVRIIGGYIVYGSDYDATYQSGKFAGRNKLGVFIERRVPMWNGVRGIVDIPVNNRAYKLGAKPTSIASTLVSWFREDNN